MSRKIGFILKGYPRISETFIAQEIQLLESRGFPIEIYALRGAREQLRQPVHKKIRAEVFYPPEVNAFFSPVAWLGFLYSCWQFPRGILRGIRHAWRATLQQKTKKAFSQLFRACWLIWRRDIGKDRTISHLHSHFVHSPTEMTYYISLISGATYSISAHAKDIYTSSEAEIYERVSKSEFLMTCTHFNWQKIRAIVGQAHEHKIHEVYHGVSLEAFRRKTEFPETPPPILITVARIVEKKGYPDVLAALKILQGRGLILQYQIYGDGDDRAQVEALIREMGLEDQVKIFGTVAQPEVIAAYEKSGVFVLASKETKSGDRDGIPNSMAEAMAMELPVVATNVSGIPELLEDGQTGLLVEPNSPLQLAEAIARLYQNPGLGKRLGRAARENVSVKFDCDRCIDRCEQLLKPYSSGSL
jgi:glycosyltransferase involved in cell wall biosynthesis